MKSLITVLASLVVSLLGTTYADITMTPHRIIVISGLIDPVIVSGTVIVSDDSKPIRQYAARIEIIHDLSDIQVRARRTLLEPPIKLQKYKDNVNNWLLVGPPGTYLVEALSLDPNKRNDDAYAQVILPEIDVSPEPIPNPDPIPPEPDNPIDDTYHVGKISFNTAPKDPTTAKTIAAWYKKGAEQLTGKDKLNDIGNILKEITMNFSLKTCKDQATCQQWDVWKKAIDNALLAEQKLRTQFTRNDWYFALSEISKSLELVK